MTNAITLDECRSYATRENMIKGVAKFGLDNFAAPGEIPMRYIETRNADGRWTAVFLVSEYFNRNKTGGYIGIASQHGFMSI